MKIDKEKLEIEIGKAVRSVLSDEYTRDESFAILEHGKAQVKIVVTKDQDAHDEVFEGLAWLSGSSPDPVDLETRLKRIQLLIDSTDDQSGKLDPQIDRLITEIYQLTEVD